MSAYYYLEQPFTYADKRYIVTAEASRPTPRVAWYEVIVQIQDHFGWTHWCDFHEGKGVTVPCHTKCHNLQIREVGAAEKSTRQFTEEKRKAFADKARQILSECY